MKKKYTWEQLMKFRNTAQKVKFEYDQPYLLSPSQKKYYLSIQSKFKDEESYLQEWIEFHLLIGVSHFYLYDEMSTDNSKEVLQPYIDKGLVTYHYWTQGVDRNDRGHCVKHYQNESNWVAFIDIDEFLFAVEENKKLVDILKNYESYPAIVVHWFIYGNSFQKKKKPGLVIERFTYREKKPNAIIKTILQPDQVIVDEINKYRHHYLYNDKNLAVDENFNFVVNRASAPYQTCNILRINHYKYKSMEEAAEKAQKLKKRDQHTLNYAKKYANGSIYNQLEDKILYRYLPILKNLVH